MKKRMSLIAVVILALLIAASAAFARVEHFTHFSIDIADGWTATEDADSSVSIFSPDGNSLIYILVAPRESPRKLDDVAAFKKGFDDEGTAMSQPQQVDDDVYVMNGMKDGVPIMAAIWFEGDWAACFTYINPQDKYERDFADMMDSIEDR